MLQRYLEKYQNAIMYIPLVMTSGKSLNENVQDANSGSVWGLTLRVILLFLSSLSPKCLQYMILLPLWLKKKGLSLSHENPSSVQDTEQLHSAWRPAPGSSLTLRKAQGFLFKCIIS